MVPSDQCLETGDVASAQVHLRLVVKLELAFIDGGTQLFDAFAACGAATRERRQAAPQLELRHHVAAQNPERLFLLYAQLTRNLVDDAQRSELLTFGRDQQGGRVAANLQ